MGAVGRIAAGRTAADGEAGSCRSWAGEAVDGIAAAGGGIVAVDGTAAVEAVGSSPAAGLGCIRRIEAVEEDPIVLEEGHAGGGRLDRDPVLDT